jgi:NADP-dependent 3-hydroxy acid dehydrogenase YdfG
MTLEDRVALITGATGPLGRVVAVTFAEAGARLVLVGTSHDRLAELAGDLGLPDDRWLPAVGDLREPSAASDVVATTTERYGRIDVLLHLVGG